MKDPNKPHLEPILNREDAQNAIPHATPRQLWKSWKVVAPALVLIALMIVAGIHYGVDTRAVGAGVVLVGLVSNAFAWIVALIGTIPILGPLLIKVLSIPIIWLLNAIGYLVSYVAIRRGFSKDVLTYRGLTVALIVGIVIGYILGKLI